MPIGIFNLRMQTAATGVERQSNYQFMKAARVVLSVKIALAISAGSSAHVVIAGIAIPIQIKNTLTTADEKLKQESTDLSEIINKTNDDCE